MLIDNVGYLRQIFGGNVIKPVGISITPEGVSKLLDHLNCVRDREREVITDDFFAYILLQSVSGLKDADALLFIQELDYADYDKEALTSTIRKGVTVADLIELSQSIEELADRRPLIAVYLKRRLDGLSHKAALKAGVKSESED